MAKRSENAVIRLRGVRHNNLKNFDLDLPLHRLIVVTGLSGSGKSSLAFDTLYAEGQRRYIETFSPYARQFFDRMDKPQVDRIEGIPPAIAIEQRNAVKSTRSTVGTMTEICEYMKLIWLHAAQLHCRKCGQPVRKDSPQQIWESVRSVAAGAGPRAGSPIQPPSLLGSDPGSTAAAEILIAFNLPLAEKLSLAESLALISKQGYQRLLIEGQIVRLEDATEHLQNKSAPSLTVIQDRLKPAEANRARFVEACEQAYHFGKGKLAVYAVDPSPRIPQSLQADLPPPRQAGQPAGTIHPPQSFSNRFHCAQCDLEYREPTSALFSFNNPVGACPACRGFGRTITIDYDLAIPDRSRTLAGGAIKPWQTGHGLECQEDLIAKCHVLGVPLYVPFDQLPQKWQDWVIQGDPDHGQDENHEWPRSWYGVKGYFRWLESRAYKMHVRVLLSRYRAYQTCSACQGQRLQPDALLFKIGLGPFTLDQWSPRQNLTYPSRRETQPPELERRSPTRRVSTDCVSAGSETGAPAQFMAPMRVPSLGVEALHDHCAPLSIAPSPIALTLPEFYQLPIRDALRFMERLAAHHQDRASDPVGLVLNEVRSRLAYLAGVGLGYLTLDRPTRTLSGGETERVNLTTCLGTRLVNTLFVLDEPSVGLHPRDTDRLVRILQSLRDAGNTILVVEHEACVIRAADQIVDLGPGQGEAGGCVVFQGPVGGLLKSKASLTGQYLSGRKRIDMPARRTVHGLHSGVASPLSSAQPPKTKLPSEPLSDPNEIQPAISRALVLAHATLHNLKDLTVQIPLGRFVCVTGVSGSGKTTLVREVLMPLLSSKFKVQSPKSRDPDGPEDSDADPPSAIGHRPSANLHGWEHLGRVVMVDQSSLGKTPRSNPAVYIGAFEHIRDLYAQSDLARQRGLQASAFSFNSVQGQCERCRGVGFEKIEMQFLSDVFIRCPDCNGGRYRAHILEITLSPKSKVQSPKSADQPSTQSWSIADMLAATTDDAIDFLSSFLPLRPAQRAVDSLRLLQEVGLGYLRLGQPINTLSGGECQRLKLVSHLAEFVQASARDLKPTMFLFDEPTTGLHFEDVRVLLQVFQRLVDAGHSLVVIEHNVDVIKAADWVIDLGPDAGDEGGQIVAQGTPELLAACSASHTGQALREVL